MKTQIYAPTEENLEKCARLLGSGEIVAFPTETVYGLGGNALLPKSVKKIYQAKGRPSDNPLIVHIANKEQVYSLAAFIPKLAEIIIEKFMPGPITVVLPKKEIVPDIVTGGLNTVALRIPENEIARKLIEKSGCPVCAPSANTSTRPSPTTARHVFSDLDGKIAAIIDGGECKVGVESTVIGFDGEKPRLLRAGGTPIEALEREIGEIEVVKSSTVALCPGMKYKHYSPTAEVFVCEKSAIIKAYDEAVNDGKRAVIIGLEKLRSEAKERNFWSVGKSVDDYAQKLFAFLRKCDDENLDAAFCQAVDETGLGSSVMNRLEKASGGKRIG